MTRLLDGRHHLERFAMEQAGEVDYLITWRDNELVGWVRLVLGTTNFVGKPSETVRQNSINTTLRISG